MVKWIHITFDGNNYSDDESETFLNLAFIHNPLLDVGGDLNPGTYGGTPGIHLKYTHNSFLAQLGTFGSGLGADFEGSIDNRITIAQLTWFQEIAAGLEKVTDYIIGTENKELMLMVIL